jgi:ABC-type phosphate transport system substrate-binding protein
MNKKTKPTKQGNTVTELTEERVREIAREEISKWVKSHAILRETS